MIDKSQQENQGEGEHDTDGTANNEVCDVPPIQQIMETNNSLSEATYEETRERGDCISVPEDDSFREEVGREMGQEGTQGTSVVPNNPASDPPIALQKSVRKTSIPEKLKDYVGYKHDLANFFCYENCSTKFKGFIAFLDATSIARDWREAMENKKWKRAMMEEMLALEKK